MEYVVCALLCLYCVGGASGRDIIFNVSRGNYEVETVFVNPGSNVTFVCEIPVKKSKDVGWFKGRNEFVALLSKRTGNCTFHHVKYAPGKLISKGCTHNKFSIVITNVQKTDEGKWFCGALVEQTPETSQKISLKVEAPTDIIFNVPRSDRDDETTVVSPGSTVRFVCIIPPNYVKRARWYQEGDTVAEITDEHSDCNLHVYDIKYDRLLDNTCTNNIFSLVLSNVQKSDEGKWLCDGRVSKRGQASQKISLKVEAPNEVHVIIPRGSSEDENITAMVGSAVTFICVIPEADRQVAMWSHSDNTNAVISNVRNECALYNTKYTRHVDQTCIIGELRIELRNIQYEDEGVWRCISDSGVSQKIFLDVSSIHDTATDTPTDILLPVFGGVIGFLTLFVVILTIVIVVLCSRKHSHSKSVERNTTASESQRGYSGLNTDPRIQLHVYNEID